MHRRIHPAVTSSLAEAHVVNLSSREALELVEGSSGGGGESGTLACRVCMLLGNVM